jgi:hypothetical protein
MKKVSCPYCLSEIVEGAAVCRECARDVAKIFLLQKEIDEAHSNIKDLKNKLEEFQVSVESIATPKAKPPIKDCLEMTLRFFFLATVLQIVMTVFGVKILILGLKVYSYVTILLIAALIYLLSKRNGIYNIWFILIFFLLQPYITFLIINILATQALDWEESLNIIRGIKLNLIFVLLFTIVMMLVKKQRDYYYVFSLKPLLNTVTVPIAKLEKLDKVGLLLLSIITSIAAIYKFFF